MIKIGQRAENGLSFSRGTAALFENLYRLGGVAASGCTKLIKRRLVLDFPFEKIRHEDEMWCTRVFPAGITVLYIPDVLYCYVMREGSIIHAEFNPSKLEIFRVIEERINVLKQYRLTDLEKAEFTKLFFAIIRQYAEAAAKKDSKAKKTIRDYYLKYKREIKISNKLSGKYKLMNDLMGLNFRFVNLYYLFAQRRYCI